MVQVGLKNWPQAIDCFVTCVAAPATAVSAVAIEAYKKLVLVSLIVSGAKPSLPAYTANAVSRALKTSAATKIYDGLAAKFSEDDVAALGAELTKNQDALAADKNLGLAKQAVAAFSQRRIQRLTSCYMTLSLTDIATHAGLAEGAAAAEAEIVNMVASGKIAAKIDAATGMVQFVDDGDDGAEDSKASLQTATKLEAMTAGVVALAARVEALDVAMSKNPAYIKNSGSRFSSGGTPHGDEGDLMDIAIAASLEDA